MAGTAIEALRADRAALLEVAGDLSEGQWAAPSGCAGWRVQDVVAHMGALFTMVVEPAALPDAVGLPTERAQDLYVEARRRWTAEEVLSDYESVSAPALDALAGLEGQDFELPLGDLGTYPASMLPNAFSFDHFTHIRADLFAPRGPLTGAPPVADELRLSPAFYWIEAALPQQNVEALGALSGVIEIELSGPGARTVRLGSGAPIAHLRSPGAAFVRWITQRGSWEELDVEGRGDEQALRLAASLRVF